MLAISHACVLGVNRIVYRELRRSGVDIHLIVPTGLGKAGNWLAAEPASVDDPPIDFLEMRGTHGRLFRFSGLVDVLDRKRPGTVLLEADTASLLTLQVARWCQTNSARLICRTNENLSWRLDEALARGGWRELPAALAKIGLNSLVRKAAMTVCTSSEQATSIFKRLGFAGACFVPMGTDRSTFRYSSALRRRTRAELGIAHADVVIAYFGRMVPEKGVDTLVRAMASLKDLRWRLLLNRFEMSTAYARSIEAQIAACGIGQRVLWASSRHGGIAGLMTASDVVVLPSISTSKWVEQYGRVVPEAMACGNLLVVTDSGAPKELVGRSGLVFPEGDADALAHTLRKIAADPEQCIRRRRAAIRHVARELSIEVEAAHYKRLVAGLWA
jgi:glycosyltransferase involved in cell wall biosynthesis